MRTDQRVSSCAFFVPLPIAQPGNDLHRTLDHAVHLGERHLSAGPSLGNRLGRLYSVIADALEALGQGMLHHPTDTCLHIHRFMFGPLCAMGAIMVRNPLAIIAIDTSDR